MTGLRLQPAGRRPRDARWREMAAGVALTIFFHGTILITALFAAWCGGGEPEPEEEYAIVFDDVELLALGEERDPDSLPRLTGDEGTPAEQDEVLDIGDDEPPEPEAEVEPEIEQDDEPDPEELRRERERREAEREAQRQREEEERQRRMNEATGRFQTEGRGDEAPEGSPDGIAGGTATDAEQANMMQTYQARLLREIERRWEIPSTISDGELQQLAGRVRVFVRLNDQGHVVEFDFRRQSGNEQFDGSIRRVIRQFEASDGGNRLPLPEEPQIRSEIINRGLILTNWETLQGR